MDPMSNSKLNWVISPMLYVNVWRFLNIGVLLHVWILGQSTLVSFCLLLILFMMTCLRWRFEVPLWLVLVDIVVCMLYLPFTDLSYYGLALPIFELAFKRRWVLGGLPFIAILFPSLPSSFVFWYYLLAFFLAMFSSAALHNVEKYRQEADDNRKVKYELERTNMELLDASLSASQQAELMERQRIARELHDHLGHDLTGASLALQAYEYVQNDQPEEAEKLLGEVKKRIERGTKSLRETVHNMTPTTLIGVERLEHIAQQFHQYLEVVFHKTGNTLLVSAHQWGLLEACLKEALTNVARHSNASQVKIELHVTNSIVRLSTRDNGTEKHQGLPGSGLRSLQMRSRSMGGSLSFSSTDAGFVLVCVIPLDKEDTSEAVNRR